MMKAYGLVTKGNGEAWITFERHMALSIGGGQAGQGYPCVLIERDSNPVTLDLYNHTIPCMPENADALVGDEVIYETTGNNSRSHNPQNNNR